MRTCWRALQREIALAGDGQLLLLQRRRRQVRGSAAAAAWRSESRRWTHGAALEPVRAPAFGRRGLGHTREMVGVAGTVVAAAAWAHTLAAARGDSQATDRPHRPGAPEGAAVFAGNGPEGTALAGAVLARDAQVAVVLLETSRPDGNHCRRTCFP